MSRAEQPESTGVEELSKEELLVALTESGILETLGVTTAELELARSDSDLLATLRITYEFVVILREYSVLNTFYGLPRRDQLQFLRWIGATGDVSLRRKRTELLVSAIEASPLGGGARVHGPLLDRGI